MLDKGILIIDDSQLIYSRLSREIKERFGTIPMRWAGSISEFKKEIRARISNIYIVDIHLKDGTGFDILADLQKRGEENLIIVLTNYPLSAYRSKALSLGADYFFDKSMQLENAMNVIESYANNHQGKS